MEIQKTVFTTYFSENNSRISEPDLEKLNSIFTECDADGNNVLENDEVPNFQTAVSQKLGHIWNYVKTFIDGIAGEPIQQVQGPQIQNVECHRNEEQQKEYKTKLAEAKKILKDNAEKLGLTEKELEYLEKFDTEKDLESITEGPARYDPDSDRVIFNINDQNEPNVGNFVKILIHEITHGVRKEEEHTKSQERACENRGTEVARKAYDMGLIDDFVVWGDETAMYKISDIDNEDNKQKFLDHWVNKCYPELDD